MSYHLPLTKVGELAMATGFMLSTAHGQTTKKMMPVSDVSTLAHFSDAVIAEYRNRTTKAPDNPAWVDQLAMEKAERVAYQLRNLEEQSIGPPSLTQVQATIQVAIETAIHEALKMREAENVKGA